MEIVRPASAQYPKGLLTSRVAIVLGIMIRIEEDVVLDESNDDIL
jgi:hypothetical protein